MTATHGVGTYGNAVGTVTPLDHKMAQLGLILKTAPNTIRAGVFWDGNSTIVSGKANMSYDVRAFSAVLSRGATSGAVLLTNDAVFNVVTTAAPGSNSRYDAIYVWQREYSIDGTDSSPVIGVVQGTPAASPTVPSLAAFPGALLLAVVLVPAGVTATNSGTTFLQTSIFTSVADGPVTVRNSTELGQYTGALTNARANNLADGVTYRWTGTAWKAWESEWIAVTPTYTGVTLGTTGASNVGRYKFVAGDVKFKGSATLGTGFTLPGPIDITLPVAHGPLEHPYEELAGSASLYHGGGPSIAGLGMTGASTTTMRMYPNNSGAVTTAISGTVPFTWVAGDAFSWDVTYAVN